MDAADASVDYYQMHIDDDTFLCCPIPNNTHVAGVMLSHRLERLQELSMKNLNLSIVCLMYIGTNITCMMIHAMDNTFRDAHDLVFHLIEFWATFAFSCVQVYALVFSPRSLGAVYSHPLVLKVIIFFNVLATFISALLVSVSLDAFETVAHELEYTNEITMSFVDVVLLNVVARQAGFARMGAIGFSVLATGVALVVAVAQLGLYNAWHGDSGERFAHDFEFVFAILSALISFSFCMDNKFMCDGKLRQLVSAQQRASLFVGQPCLRGAAP